MTGPAKQPLQLWGGLECSIVRIGAAYRDQFQETGHYERPTDLDAVAGLGIRTLRYPVLWEVVSPDNPDIQDFGWHDKRLARLEALGIEPVIGLMHHGSGPRYTDLLDRSFPELLAAHALRVAERYPHVRRFTPINEPLTTARFSALYGFWYPHRTDMHDFCRAVVNQCRATMLCMRAIRTVNPAAELVQTEDMGKTFSTARLKYQADYENERRWLSLDLLFGRVGNDHPWHRILIDHGIEQAELEELERDAVPPAIVGINYYLTSERFLDHRREHWPEWQQAGGNGRHHYADLEAVRIHLPTEDTGLEHRLREVWGRYGTTIAVTEVHLGCSRDEQLRWLSEIWQTAKRLRNDHIDITAVTIWSMFGSMDWNSLLRRSEGSYEAGAFDVRGRSPQPTALASAAAAICRDGNFDHPILDRPGWWRRPDRFHRLQDRPEKTELADRCALVVATEDAPLPTLQTVLDLRGMDCTAIRLPALPRTDAAHHVSLSSERQTWAIILLLGGDPDPSMDMVRAHARQLDLPLLLFSRTVGPHPLHHQTSPPLLIPSCRIYPPIAGAGGRAGAADTVTTKPVGTDRELRASSLEDLFHLGLDLLLDSGGSRYFPAYAA